MKTLLLSFIIMLSGREAMASIYEGPVAKVFAFTSKIKNSDNEYSCTATLIKVRNECHLLTNNHCVENKIDFKVNFLKTGTVEPDARLDNYTEQYALSSDTTPISVDLKKVNRRLDLALLSYKSEQLQNVCNDLEPISIKKYVDGINPELVKVFVATGVVNQLPSIKYTAGVKWSGGYGATQIFAKYNVGNGLYFWNASDLDIIPGMSGSPIVNTEGAFIGIASKYVDFQNSALLIPTQMILLVIEGSVPDLPEMDLGSFQNNATKDAGNEHGGAGNEHGGAGNEHGGAGGTASKAGLPSFRSPDEGVLINNEIVLGFTSKDGMFGKTYYHQIDGRDEYQVKVNEPDYLAKEKLKGKIGPFITRPTNGYPDIKIRQEIVNRMDGFYYLESYQSEVAKPFNQNRATYLLASNAPRGITELRRKTVVLMIDVNPKTKKVSIESQDLNLEFDISYSADFKQIYLSKDKLRLTCDNKHLLKLVCSNDEVEFSLSVNHTGSTRYLKYRLAYKDNIEGYQGISYWYGAVGSAPNAEEWRKK